ncbi:unnamed protein product [Protopolystoma xenopodis]|uniref:Uncharacterized protein n=1 Tax=Protopolystoma xenopodis TaxID=117903 RepID=A0A448X5W1_9PLAT|nr:unnamed protein product [Protopolystoma xenopodis]
MHHSRRDANRLTVDPETIAITPRMHDHSKIGYLASSYSFLLFLPASLYHFSSSSLYFFSIHSSLSPLIALHSSLLSLLSSFHSLPSLFSYLFTLRYPISLLPYIVFPSLPSQYIFKVAQTRCYLASQPSTFISPEGQSFRGRLHDYDVPWPHAEGAPRLGANATEDGKESSGCWRAGCLAELNEPYFPTRVGIYRVIIEVWVCSPQLESGECSHDCLHMCERPAVTSPAGWSHPPNQLTRPTLVHQVPWHEGLSP